MTALEAELLFPPRVIPALGSARGPAWQDLVSAAAGADEASPEQAAFVLMMARLNNCATCTPDSHRNLLGCPACSQQTLKHFRGSDQDLLYLYETARQDVCQFLASSGSFNGERILAGQAG
jgi:hypothetical protein